MSVYILYQDYPVTSSNSDAELSNSLACFFRIFSSSAQLIYPATAKFLKCKKLILENESDTDQIMINPAPSNNIAPVANLK